MLFGSGLVGGGGLTGVLLAIWVGMRGGRRIEGFSEVISERAGNFMALLAIFAILGLMAFFASRGAPAEDDGRAGDDSQ